MLLEPVLVTVEPANTAKLWAEPSNGAVCAETPAGLRNRVMNQRVSDQAEGRALHDGSLLNSIAV